MDGDILFYGCNLAEGKVGQSLVARIADLTGADVAASTDATGASKLGGNWILEYQTGLIEADLPLATNDYDGLLASPTLESTTFFGGPGDQAATDIDYAAGAVYVSGNNPFSSASTASAFVLKYGTPNSNTSTPSWTRNWTLGAWYGIVAADSEVYTAGWSHPGAGLTVDGAGGSEPKTLVAAFNADGVNGAGPDGSNWVGVVPTNFNSSPGTSFFQYTGHEGLEDVVAVVEGGNIYLYAGGGGQPQSYRLCHCQI